MIPARESPILISFARMGNFLGKSHPSDSPHPRHPERSRAFCGGVEEPAFSIDQHTLLSPPNPRHPERSRIFCGVVEGPAFSIN